MDSDFWRQRWDDGQIGFHQPQGQPLLFDYWPTFGLARHTPVLVPLCGKTPDMAWLAARGHPVTGVEFSARAARDFFVEQALGSNVEQVRNFERHQNPDQGVEILVGDFLALSTAALGVFGGVYDRAALIALPREQRAAYAAHLLGGLPAGAAILLIALNYDAREMQGPPFAVDEAEVRTLFGRACAIEKLCERDALRPGDHLSSKGLTWAREHVYRLIHR